MNEKESTSKHMANGTIKKKKALYDWWPINWSIDDNALTSLSKQPAKNQPDIRSQKENTQSLHRYQNFSECKSVVGQ